MLANRGAFLCSLQPAHGCTADCTESVSGQMLGFTCASTDFVLFSALMTTCLPVGSFEQQQLSLAVTAQELQAPARRLLQAC